MAPELRRFRHFFRNAYVLDVDPVRIREHADRLRRIAPDVEGTLDAFRRHLSGVARRSRRAEAASPQ